MLGRKWCGLALGPLGLAGVLILIGGPLLPAQPPQAKKEVPKAVVDKLKLQPELIQRAALVKGSTPEQLAAIPAGKIPRVVQRASYPDLPAQRAAFRARQERDEKGVIPPGARAKAIRQLVEMTEKNQRPKTAGVPTGKAIRPATFKKGGLKTTDWVWLGPGNIGGRVRSIVVRPDNPDRMWAASVGGGIWVTDDGGTSWGPVNDFMVNLAVTSLAINPAKPDEMYATTGEGFFNGDALRGSGVFKSTDGGRTWEQLPSTVAPAFHWANRVAVSKDGTTVLVATRGENPGTGGIQRSADGGKTWTAVVVGDFADVKFDPTDPAKAVAGTLYAGDVFFSADGGQNWTAATHDQTWSGRVELAYAAKDSKIIYAAVDRNGGEVWRSDDGGQKFALQHTGSNYLGTQGWYGNVIWAGDPADDQLVLVGGVDLWRSTDGGKNFTDISTWWADNQTSAHADHHVIVADPRFGKDGNKTVFFGNDGGVYMTADVRTVGNDPQPPRVSGWKELNNTFGVTQLFGVAGNANGVMVVGAQDNGTLRYDPAGGAEKFTEMFGGDGGACAADPTDPNIFYGEYVYLGIHRSNDGGKTSDYISGQLWNPTAGEWQWKPFPYSIPDARSQQALFIAPFVQDRNKSGRLLAGGMELWVTNDATAPLTTTSGPRWASIKRSAGKHISAIAVAHGDSKLIWVGHEDGQVYVTTNGTAEHPSWKRLGAPGPSPLPGRYCHRIVIDPDDHNRVFVCTGGYAQGNLWRTLDGGKTWAQLGKALPEAPVRTLAIHPTRPKFVYAGTEVGIFASEDGGDTWSVMNEGPANCSVEELIWMGTKLTAATHGRGLFQIDLANPQP
jgi:photosystem II stability/assembly factor-like uncharacterized protein